MTKEEIQKKRKEYEAEQLKRSMDKKTYPWFMYQGFGWHQMSYLTDKEAEETIKFYRLFKCGENTWVRYGKQPIHLTRRND